jgi:hypothetical protein
MSCGGCGSAAMRRCASRGARTAAGGSPRTDTSDRPRAGAGSPRGTARSARPARGPM